MLIEQLIFTVISFAIFVLLFFKMIRNNDTSYVIVLVLEAIGIALNFLEVLFGIKLNIIFVILKYILSILLPIFIIILEKRNIRLVEIVYYSKAKLYAFLGNNKRTKQALLTLLDKCPNSYKAHKMLAELYEQEGGMRKAIDEYVQAIDLNKQDTNSYFKVANLLNGLDKKQEASEMLFTLINKKPDMQEASMLLGEILIEQERYKEVANIHRDALKYAPLSYDINYNLGIVYTMLNDFQNAKICYEKAAEINALAYHAKYALAEIALIYKDLDEAESKFLQAIELEELTADGYFELAKIYLLKGDKDTAIKYANTAIDSGSKRIVQKVKKDPLFITILAKLTIPFNLEEENEEISKTMAAKELKAKEHLEEMTELTRHLSYNDIGLLKKDYDKKNEIDKTNEDMLSTDKQKEIQE